MSSWKECKLGELITHKKGFAFKSKDFKPEGHRVVKVKDFTSNSIDISKCEFFDVSIANQFYDYQLKENDIIIATVGSWPSNPASIVGKVIKVPKKAEDSLLNQNAVRLRSEEQINQLYVYYKLKTIEFSDYLISRAQGSANQASITLNDIFNYSLELPPLEEQKAIAEVLSSLDDKIDLLHRQNQTLESLAQTLFRQWFIEELDTTTYKLEELVDSVSVKHSFKKEQIIFLNTSDIHDGNVLHQNYSNVNTLPGQAKKSIKKGDILFTEIRPANKRFAYIDFEAEDYVVSTKLMVLRSKKVFNTSLIYLFLKQQETLDYLQMIAEFRSGTFPQITFDQLKEVEIFIPNNMDILRNSMSVFDDVVDKSFKNQKQIKTLENLRDTLLPKLLSGEVRVKI